MDRVHSKLRMCACRTNPPSTRRPICPPCFFTSSKAAATTAHQSGDVALLLIEQRRRADRGICERRARNFLFASSLFALPSRPKRYSTSTGLNFARAALANPIKAAASIAAAGVKSSPDPPPSRPAGLSPPTFDVLVLTVTQPCAALTAAPQLPSQASATDWACSSITGKFAPRSLLCYCASFGCACS